MENEIYLLGITAITIGFLHTVLGPDHYLPFIAMSKARNWSNGKTLTITFFCGLGHVLSSILLGMVGVALGIAIFKLENVESARAEIATWALIAFGFTYLIWGIHRALKNKAHSHDHLPTDSGVHSHSHHDDKPTITPWVLFTIFVLGPCEPLIPILMYPAARHSISSLILVSALFGTVTIGTMMGLVITGCLGFSFLPLKRMERYMHALAGGTLSMCGLAMLFGL